MNRRELVAGVGSVGILSGAGVILFRGGSRAGSGDETDEPSSEPLTVESIDAPGSEAGSIPVPPAGADATVVALFSTTCDPCHAEVAAATEAREQLGNEYGDAVRFLAVAAHPPGTVSEADIRDWWATYGGDWPVALDPNARLKERYAPLGAPTTIVIDGDGMKRWMETGPNDTRTIVDAVESTLETDEGGASDEASEADERLTGN